MSYEVRVGQLYRNIGNYFTYLDGNNHVKHRKVSILKFTFTIAIIIMHDIEFQLPIMCKNKLLSGRINKENHYWLIRCSNDNVKDNFPVLKWYQFLYQFTSSRCECLLDFNEFFLMTLPKRFNKGWIQTPAWKMESHFKFKRNKIKRFKQADGIPECLHSIKSLDISQ